MDIFSVTGVLVHIIIVMSKIYDTPKVYIHIFLLCVCVCVCVCGLKENLQGLLVQRQAHGPR